MTKVLSPILFFDVPLTLQTDDCSVGEQCGNLLVQAATVDEAIDFSLRWMDFFLEMAGNRFLAMLVATPKHRPDLVADEDYRPANGVLSVLLFWEHIVPKVGASDAVESTTERSGGDDESDA